MATKDSTSFLTIIGIVNGRYRTFYKCRCICGQIKQIRKDHFDRKESRSCGCLTAITARNSFFKHGLTNTKTHSTWVKMRARCEKPNLPEFRYYGALGVRVCDRWQNFTNFFNDMGEQPQFMSIDRIDVTGNYEPNNCRWATITQQARNKRKTIYIEYLGEKRTIPEWAEMCGLKYGTLWARLAKKLPINIALKELTAKQWAQSAP